MNDAISRSAAIDIINEERRLIESLRETVYDNEDRAHNTGELGCAIRLARNIKELPALDVAPVVHEQWIEACCGKVCICSRCGQEFDYTCNEIKDEWLFCHKCGAKMDAEEDPDVG